MSSLNLCPCGSDKNYEECCHVFHIGKSLPETAEQLMRSRYSAYSMKNLDYIQQTMTGKAAEGFHLENAKHSAEKMLWLGLEVIRTEVDKSHPNRAYVEFRALYNQQGHIGVLSELSEFQFKEGRWWYSDGSTKKMGRNEPCPCHSGKKFKHCHARAF